MPDIARIGMELRRDFILVPGTPLGYIGKIGGMLELSRLPEMAEAMGSSTEEGP